MNPSANAITNPDRLAALEASGLLSPSFEPALDRITRLVTSVLRVPVSLISLVDKDRQYFKSYCGLPEPIASQRETPLSHSFCQHVVVNAEPLIVVDATKDPRVMDNLAVPEIGVIAYAGVPIVGEDGFVLGSLCAIDGKPREWSAQDIDILTALAGQIAVEVDLRLQSFRLAHQLEGQQRIEADRQEMIRLNVHDLRTPLSAIVLGLDALKFLGPLSDKQTEFIKICRRSGSSMINMVNNLIDIGLIDQRGRAALNLTTCKPRALIKSALEQVHLLADEKSLDLTWSLPDATPPVLGDTDKLGRVLVNLLANAIKFTHAGGRVEITARVSPEDESLLQFMIRDTGIGIPAGSHIFDEGVRVDENAPTTKSSGLGLTFCQRIVAAHGGRIWYDSDPAVGSNFYFTIPIQL